MQNSSDKAKGAWFRRTSGCLLICVVAILYWLYGVLYVEGSSMQPTLFPGDLVVYQRAGSEFARGDVVVFRYEGGLVVHRIVAVEPDGSFRMRGDANESSDTAPVHRDQIRGTVRGVIPLGRALHRVVSATQ